MPGILPGSIEDLLDHSLPLAMDLADTHDRSLLAGDGVDRPPPSDRARRIRPGATPVRSPTAISIPIRYPTSFLLGMTKARWDNGSGIIS